MTEIDQKTSRSNLSCICVLREAVFIPPINSESRQFSVWWSFYVWSLGVKIVRLGRDFSWYVNLNHKFHFECSLPFTLTDNALLNLTCTCIRYMFLCFHAYSWYLKSIAPSTSSIQWMSAINFFTCHTNNQFLKLLYIQSPFGIPQRRSFPLITWYIASGFVCARELTWRSHVDCDDSFYGRLGRSCDVYTYRGDVWVCVASQTQIKLVFLLLSLLLYTQKFGDFIWLCYVCDIIYGLLWFLEICFRGRWRTCLNYFWYLIWA